MDLIRNVTISMIYLFQMFTNVKNHYQSVLPKGRSFTASSSIKAADLPKDRSSTTNSGTRFAVLLGMNRCGSFSLISAPYSSLASEQILKDLKRLQGPHRGGEESGFG